jgi:hypothetical protein
MRSVIGKHVSSPDHSDVVGADSMSRRATSVGISGASDVTDLFVRKSRRANTGGSCRLPMRKFITGDDVVLRGFSASNRPSVRLADSVLDSNIAQGKRTRANVEDVVSSQASLPRGLRMKLAVLLGRNSHKVRDPDAPLVSTQMVNDHPIWDRSLLPLPDDAMRVSPRSSVLTSRPTVRPTHSSLPYVARGFVTTFFDCVGLRSSVGVPADETPRFPSDVPVTTVVRSGNGGCLTATTFAKTRRVHLGSPSLESALLGWSAGETQPAPDCTIGGA